MSSESSLKISEEKSNHADNEIINKNSCNKICIKIATIITAIAIPIIIFLAESIFFFITKNISNNFLSLFGIPCDVDNVALISKIIILITTTLGIIFIETGIYGSCRCYKKNNF